MSPRSDLWIPGSTVRDSELTLTRKAGIVVQPTIIIGADNPAEQAAVRRLLVARGALDLADMLGVSA